MKNTISYQLGALSLFLGLLATEVLSQTAAGSQPQDTPTTTGQTQQQLRWFIFREDCFDMFFYKHDFSNSECLKLTFSKAIGYAIILGSSILKLPQIIKILNAGSVAGISKSLFYLEILTLLHASTYSMRYSVPFSVYGESLIILV